MTMHFRNTLCGAQATACCTFRMNSQMFRQIITGQIFNLLSLSSIRKGLSACLTQPWRSLLAHLKVFQPRPNLLHPPTSSLKIQIFFLFSFLTSGALKMAYDQNPAFISFQKPKMLFFTKKYPG